ncbi:MAG: hypothetical protein B7C24_18110 [Bacteroidetes bacterium 4572_77]|nr:MAG: hypothetical protein B7C24_18110 [Bacteroidetes bacterium 4572_77]
MIYPLLLFILAVFYGLLYTLIFLNYNIVYQGIEPLSFYLITLFTATKFRQYVDLPSINYRLRVAFVSFAMLAVWVILTVMPAIRFGITAIYPELLSLIFGVSTGLLSFGFMKFLYKRNTFKKNKSSAEAQGIQMPDKEELTPAIISASHIEQMIEKDKELFYSKQNAISSEPEENEQRLNKILEKINAEGRESLTDDEQAFLFYYSQQL